MTGALAILARDLRLALRQGSDVGLVVGFFVLAAVLFPFGVGPEPQLLARIAVGIVWVTALLAAMLSLDRLFQADYDDGTLDLIAAAPVSPALVALAKATAHWLTTGLPLIVISPVLGLMLNLDPAALPVLLASMALGTPTLSLVGTIGAALTLGARRGGALVSLLVLPLVLPVLIFGVGAVEAELTGLGARPHLMILAALMAGSLSLAPAAASLAIRQALD